METFIRQIFNILTSPPGNLIYHLILAFSIAVTLQSALASQRTNRKAASQRMLLGLVILLLGQLVLFLSSGLAWQNIADPQIFLPPLDRAIIALSLIWIVWLWCFPSPNRFADTITGILNLVVILLFLFTYSIWRNTDPALPFNTSGLDLGWGTLCITIALAGILFLLLERPTAWGTGVGILLLQIAGYTIHLIYTGPAGNFAAPIRLAQICTFPLLPTIVQQLQQSQSAGPEQKANGKPVPFVERRRYTADPRAAYTWLDLAAQEDIEDIHTSLPHAIAQTLLADLCILVQKRKSSEQLILQGGYDLIQEESLPQNIAVPADSLPMIANAIQRGRPFQLDTEEQQTPDPDTLVEILGLEASGNLLFIPINSHRKTWGGIILLSPYSNRIWKSEDQTYLMTATNILAQILENAERRDYEKEEHLRTKNELELSRLQLSSMESDTNPVQIEQLQDLQPQRNQEAEIEKLISLQEETQQIIQELKEENDHLAAELRIKTEAVHQNKSEATQQLKNELRLSLQEVAYLKNSLADANLKILRLEKESEISEFLPEDNQKFISTIVQELRQPLASVVGYTELLLSETGGILGTVQQNFLERIKSSLGQIHVSLNQMMQEGKVTDHLFPEANLEQVIDTSLASAGEQLHEKKIALKLNLPDQFPEINANQDMIQQIIDHLLNNAILATPFKGDIYLSVQEQNQGGMPYLLIQVRDSGGGIETEDLSRVFSQRFRGEKPVIKGIGDSGAGLTIAKTLTEALNGRIWVESEPGKGTLISVLLPGISEEKQTAAS